ncbi:hypothetical protein FisN_14Lh036 [Fistulifera solaris]|uniref:Uncharacterized protein n=1 Tax=Fistulifera solaris TaxID=1519565 RepID=A0A1Z5KHD0_FISSO|nr:hypothetical protein FisN_14Lh036 [Fistulifera solaris]|eukprot:GAX25724.1 hypothetical protein FisN_14Lh036 [Fistulifera solaris]
MKPWQWDWKHPQWHHRSTRETILAGELIDHAAAHVSRKEIPASFDPASLNFVNDSDVVLTVSLLRQPPSTFVLNITILRHDATAGTSRSLTWPSSLLQENDNNSSSFWSFGWRPQKQHSIMAVCLCRLTSDKDPEVWLILNALSLVSAPHELATTKHTELRLLCLASNGIVYMYDPWLLLLSVKTTPQDDDIDLQDGMVSFLLGEALLQTLQQSMFPLSQPLRTWSLMIESNNKASIQLHKAVVVWDSLLCVWGSDVASNAGFIEFTSLRTFSTLRTVSLEFVPLHLTPVLWKDQEWVMVVGDRQTVLIRTDAATKEKKENEDTVEVDRFQMLCIDLGMSMDTTYSSCQIVGWGMRSKEDPVLAICCVEGTVVRIWTRTLTTIRFAEEGTPVVMTRETRAPFTQFQLPNLKTSPTTTPRFHMGPGWILMVGSAGVYLVCLEGATSNGGAYVQRLSTEAMDGSQVMDIAPLSPDDEDVKHFDLKLSSNHPLSRTGKELNWLEGDVGGSSLHDSIVEALNDLPSNAAALRNDKNDSDSPKITTTSKERVQRLLRHCSSWKQLDEKDAARQRYFERQMPCVSVGSQHVVSFRQSSTDLKTRVPFQSVLSWLSDREDYFTAASLALCLLNDVRTLRHLWKCFDKAENEDDLSTLEGLLDGILPLSDNEKDGGNASGSNTQSQLADMAIGCLIKGGVDMSSTLTLFLATSHDYDPSRICLMLAAAISSSCSAWKDRAQDALQQNDMEQSLWPVRALLEVGNSRDCLSTAILLLNAIIPDELRCRTSTESNTTPSMELCQALVHLIVTLSDAATQMLIDMTDEQSQKTFWESLDDSTRQELALIEEKGKFPLLRQVQVRSWATAHLSLLIEHLASAEVISIEWVRRLAICSLLNADCPLAQQKGDLSLGGQDQTNDTLLRYKQHVLQLRKDLVAAPGSGGLDVDLLIPCLLILTTKNEPLFPASSYSTQSILNAASHFAGRRNTEAPLFPMNAVVLMRECFLADNILAGAHFIGGRDGLVLQCCHVLMGCLDNFSMTDAEQFVLATSTSSLLHFETSPTRSSAINLSESHCALLFLLEEHVLSIRKYGDFDTAHSREKVDPEFAARAILRTWWRTFTCTNSISSEWLMEWLDDGLQLGLKNRATTSPYRLACAALIRVLLWSDEDNTPSLATLLGFSNDFLVRLSLSCCGLVEALPASVMEKSWKQHHYYSTSTSNFKGQRSESPPCSPITTPSRMTSDGGMDDISFQSAVSSLDMM